VSRAGRLELVGLGKQFGDVVAVDGVDLTVEAGELATLLGPSGSGKTTILRTIAGFESPSRGRILIDGKDVSSLSPAKRDVGVVFQHYALFPHMTAAQNIAYPLRLRRVPGAERRLRVERALELVQLDGLGDRRPAELSGGQQQRVALARALVYEPSVLLMDEPLGALDRALRLELEHELRSIRRQTGVTVLYVTHDQEEALALSDRVAIIREGRLLQEGTPGELYENPRDTFVARFLGECNLLPITVGNRGGSPCWRLAYEPPGRERDWLGPAPARTAGRWHLMLRAARLRVGGGGDLQIAATVDDVLYLGETTRLRCASPEAGALVVELPSRTAPSLRRGERIELAFELADARLVPDGDAPVMPAPAAQESVGAVGELAPVVSS
jgi:putative spermidine/putrescine transport system ATP-binding protein